ncbi:hypothetical protein S83_034926 [Arachis hypogaea]|nr:uncharacterized protein DS421_11g327050 [Arachis hypogaea]
MGKCQAMHKYFGVFLALLVAFNHTHLTQGRKIIKPLNTNNINPHQPIDSSSVGESVKKSMVVLLESLEAKKVSVNGVGPGPSPGAGHRNVMKSMGAVVVVVKNNEDVKDSINGVGPGHSPGVGHKN